ncbi:hypothetical protein C0J52_21727 [Blattella germanica]|nr:hypothetical protein C0J52_21727 [Blattella germanica]
MADKIKKFFQKKKVDAKFKLAGPGHKLTEESASRSSSNSGSSQTSVVRRTGQSTEMKQAAAAALARYNEQKQDPATFTSLAYIQAQVRREMEAEKKAQAEKMKEATPPPSSEPKILDMSQHLSVSGVYFKCPMIGPDILTKDEWNTKIKEFLYEQLEEKRGLTSCLIIHTLNKNREKVAPCVETLCRYLENIIQNPTEEKFRKIRFSNRVYQDKVACLEGTQDFLMAAGFEVQRLPFQDGEEDFWGTFSVYEKFAAVNKFVKETLYNEELPFRLTSPAGHLLMDEDSDKTLADLRMVPAAVLTFSWGPNVVQEYDGQHEKILKPEIQLLCQNL